MTERYLQNSTSLVKSEGCALCYMRTVMVLVSSGLSIVVNILAIAAIVTSSALQDGTRYFTLALAVSDLGMGLTYIWTVNAAWYGKWVMGTIFCEINAAFFQYFAQVSIYFLMLMCLDRFIAISYPFKYIYMITPTNCKILISTSAVLVLVVTVMPLLGLDKYSYSQYEYLCAIDPGISGNAMLATLILVFPPIFLIYTLNMMIWRIAVKQNRKIAAEQAVSAQVQANGNVHSVSAGVSTNTGTAIDGGEQSQQQSLAQSRRKMMKTIKMVAMVVFAFSVSWLPCLILNALQSFQSQLMPEPAAFLAIWLGISNSFVSFFVYNITNSQFRSAVVKILKCSRSY